MTSAPSSVSRGSHFSRSPLRSVSACSRQASASSPTSSSPCSTKHEDAGAAQRLYLLLREFEQAQDAAFAIGGEVATMLAAAQAEQRLGAAVGQPAFKAFSEALVHLSSARGSTIDGHRSLEKIARVFGIDFTAADDFGDSRKYPPSGMVGVRAESSVAA